MVAKNLNKMVKENNSNEIRRMQDVAFMRLVKAAITYHGNYIGGDNADGTSGVIDWSTSGPTKLKLTALKGKITAQELKPERWLMSQLMWDTFSAMDAGEIGDLAGDMFKHGLTDKKLLELPAIVTVKSQLNDGTTGGAHFFDYTSGSNVYTNIYLFVAPNYLGKIVKVGTDSIWSEWKKDVFHWNSWRYVGIGFGDSRGIARLRVKLS